MSGEERGRQYVRGRLWWLMETVLSSLKEFESHCFPSEQLRPIEIVLVNINHRQTYFQSTGSDINGFHQESTGDIFQGPSDSKLRSKIITIFPYEDVDASFSYSLENLGLFLSICRSENCRVRALLSVSCDRGRRCWLPCPL